MNQVESAAAAIRWVEFVNGSGETVPAFGVMRPTGCGSDGTLTMGKPTGASIGCFFNGPVDCPAGASGLCTRDTPIHALYDTADGTPANGDTWGSASGTWKLKKNQSPGYAVLGGDTDGRVWIDNVPPTSAAAASVTIQGTDPGSGDAIPTSQTFTTLDVNFGSGLSWSVVSASEVKVACQPASLTHDGVVTTGTQSINGDKTFNSNLTFNGAAFTYAYAAGPVFTVNGYFQVQDSGAGTNYFSFDVGNGIFNVNGVVYAHNLNPGVSGTFTTADTPAKTVTVSGGIITSIV